MFYFMGSGIAGSLYVSDSRVAPTSRLVGNADRDTPACSILDEEEVAYEAPLTAIWGSLHDSSTIRCRLDTCASINAEVRTE